MAELNVVLSNPEQGTTREQELIAQVQRGQTGLFYELVRPYERRVYAAALAILRNEADAEDAAQEAMLKRSEEHTSELQSLRHLVCRLLLEKKKRKTRISKRLLNDTPS